MSGARILAVEDEPQLRFALRRFLEESGYVVRLAENGAIALAEFASFKPDLVLLDLMLPDSDGVEICAQIRRSHNTPIIVLSALGDEKTKVRALDEGADDYLTKPFGMGELTARIRVALRHVGANTDVAAIIALGELRIDLEKRIVTVQDEEVRLTPTEYSLLKYLVTNPGKVLTHPMILRAVWGSEYSQDTGVLRTAINQLRSKLHDDPVSPSFILTEPRIGYRFLTPD